MTPERWQKLDKLFHEALEREPEARPAFVEQVCAGDDELRQELDSMLDHHEQANSFIESPAYVIDAETIVDDDFAETLIGKTFRQYQIIDLLGKGGMGVVYMAFDNDLHRNVALKCLHDDLLSDSQRVQRFKQEARAVSALNHPNILTIHQIGDLDGRQFIATEFVEGQTLRALLANQSLTLTASLDIVTQVTSALIAAHQAGIIHRDIKPSNVIIEPITTLTSGRTQRAILMDFGTARFITENTILTGSGDVMGTADYISPEQIHGITELDSRTDQYSFGVMTYQLLTGKKPFERNNTWE